MKKKITKKLLSEAIKNAISEYYRMQDTEEIMEYLWLKPQITGLNVDIFADDGFSFERHKHVPLVFARNGYDRSTTEFIPFEISREAQILNTDIDYKITYNDIFDVQDFIDRNSDLLLLLAQEKISQSEFVSKIRKFVSAVMENKKLLSEMATLRMADSNLPMDIWVDEGATYQGHAPRLKFRANKEQRTTREFSSMLLTNPPTIENFPKNSPLKSKDIEALEKFVIDNLEILLALANNEIDYVTEFLPAIKK